MDPPDPRELLALLAAGDVDAAIEAGLMRYTAGSGDPPETDIATLLQAQRRLRDAWAARDRYRARSERLARLQAERDARRSRAPVAQARPGLPAAAAAALARARAKASGSRPA